MSITSATELLGDLSDRGIELQAAVGHLRYRPQSAMTQDLIERVRANKAELILFLQGADADRTPAHELESAVVSARDPVDTEIYRFFGACVTDGNGWRDPATEHSAGICLLRGLREERPHPSIPAGWSGDGWIRLLTHMSESCAPLHPGKAAEFMQKAIALDPTKENLSFPAGAPNRKGDWRSPLYTNDPTKARNK